MLCCGLAACTLAAAAISRSRGRRGVAAEAKRLALASAAAVALALVGLSAGVALHLDHHRARAALHHRSLVAQILAAPLCGGPLVSPP